jgi:hypothetical protein
MEIDNGNRWSLEDSDYLLANDIAADINMKEIDNSDGINFTGKMKQI